MEAGVMDAGREMDVPEQLPHRQVLMIFGGLMLALLLAALDSTIVSTALPTIVGELGGLAHLSWVVTAYLLAQTIVTPVYGKLGDLYGRKGVLQAAVVLFLLGSILCGLSQSLTQLIIFRFLQGLGGGGLMVTTQATVGDIVTPRERGRYQGVFGAVFGLASVAGPLLGGYFTKYWTWRWIFYINIPIGIVALIVLAATLPSRSVKVRHAIDYLGSGLFATFLSGLILIADLGGTEYPWSSPIIVGLIAMVIIALILFLVVEGRAIEPVMPLRLFRNRSFCVASALGLIVGFALWGTVTYLPVYLQVVKGASPTASGLQLLPLMAGVLTMSITSGQIISRTGRYKFFPILGMAVMASGIGLISRMPTNVSVLTSSLYFLCVGLGLGMVMQVLIIAIQNAVDYRDMGVATSGTLLFRLMGGSIGTAILGTIFAAQLHYHLDRLLPAGTATSQHVQSISPQSILQMPMETRALYSQAFAAAFSTVFLVAAGIAGVGFLIAWLLPEHPLRETIAAAVRTNIGEEVGEAFDMPVNVET